MDYIILRAELDAGHPVTGAYSQTDATAVAQLNAVNVTRQRTHMSASQLFEALDVTEYKSLDATKRAMVDRVMALGDEIGIGAGTKARDFLLDAFPGGTATRTALLALVQEPSSRVQVLGLGPVHVGDVQNARAL